MFPLAPQAQQPDASSARAQKKSPSRNDATRVVDKRGSSLKNKTATIEEEEKQRSRMIAIASSASPNPKGRGEEAERARAPNAASRLDRHKKGSRAGSVVNGVPPGRRVGEEQQHQHVQQKVVGMKFGRAAVTPETGHRWQGDKRANSIRFRMRNIYQKIREVNI